MHVTVTPEALKQYRHLPKTVQTKIKRRLDILEKNPFEGKKLSGDLSEERSLRAWPYRILYYIDTNKKEIFIITIAHRQGVYK